MTRSVPEWRGKTDDAAIPPRVRLRVFDRYSGVCHFSGRKIRAGDIWHCDHIVPLIEGGQHKESNLAPILLEPHKRKTREEMALKAKIYRKKAAHLGLKKSRNPMMGSKASGWKRKMDGTVVKRDV